MIIILYYLGAGETKRKMRELDIIFFSSIGLFTFIRGLLKNLVGKIINKFLFEVHIKYFIDISIDCKKARVIFSRAGNTSFKA